MILLWALLVIVGLAGAWFASTRAVHHASALSFGTKIPPFIIGLTLVAIGTDLPEIANSIVASISDHGDLNISDSVGSAVTQLTLVLGLLPIVAGAFVVSSLRVGVVGTLTSVSLIGGAILLSDGFFSRQDALILVSAWAIASFVVWRVAPTSPPSLVVPSRTKAYHAIATLGMLIAVGASATVAVNGFIQIAEALAVPEYLLGFFAASLGTSLPELAVGVTALRRGERDLAVGDVVGSSLADSTLSIGIGPLIAPTAITASLAVRGGLAAAAVILMVTLVLAWRGRHTWATGLLFLAVYAAFYPLLLFDA